MNVCAARVTEICELQGAFQNCGEQRQGAPPFSYESLNRTDFAVLQPASVYSRLPENQASDLIGAANQRTDRLFIPYAVCEKPRRRQFIIYGPVSLPPLSAAAFMAARLEIACAIGQVL